MCKYCQKEDRASVNSLYSKSFDNELESANVSLSIFEDSLLIINASCYDTLRQTQLGMAASFGINYCPWCGRKVAED